MITTGLSAARACTGCPDRLHRMKRWRTEALPRLAPAGAHLFAAGCGRGAVRCR
jgi:hypothetical protein